MSDRPRKDDQPGVSKPNSVSASSAKFDATADTGIGSFATLPGTEAMATAPYAQMGSHDDLPDLRGKLIGNLALTALLGTGAMGSVYSARHRTLGTSYAVKVLHPRFAADESALERFKFEAIACSRLRHENVVFVTDFGFHQEIGLYITMELLEGRSLRSILSEQGKLSLKRAVRIVDQICAGIAAAHRLAIVHRDLKPDNVVILADPSRRDFAKVLDFGIAKMKRQAGEPLTHEGLIMGTAAYMAPEQLSDSAPVGPKTDIYALGCMLFELITGSPPFSSKSEFEVMASHLNDTAPLLGERQAALKNSSLEKLIAAMLSKLPDERPASMDEVQQLLASAMADLKGSVALSAETGEYRILSTPSTTQPGASNLMPSVARTVQQIQNVGPTSPAALLIGALKSTQALPGDTLCHALWGVISLELLEQSEHSPRFGVAAEQATLLYQLVLQNGSDKRAEAFRRVAFGALKRILKEMEANRRRRFNKALLPLCGHPLFPKELIPAETSGTWQTFEPPSVAASDMDEEEAETLLDKLSQDASLASLRAVLGHEIRLFGSKKRSSSGSAHVKSDEDKDDPERSS